MKLEPITYRLPSYWASYLINGDASGIEDSEQEEADAFLKDNDLPGPVDCEDAGFCHSNDAGTLAGDCMDYTFLIEMDDDSGEKLYHGCFDGLRGLEISMTMEQARGASHQGQCDEDCKALARVPAISAQLDALGTDKIRDGLRECGAWDAEELADDAQNRVRAVWIAAGNIVENAGEQE